MGFIQGSQNFKSLNFKVFRPLNVLGFFFLLFFQINDSKNQLPSLIFASKYHYDNMILWYYGIMVSLTHEMS